MNQKGFALVGALLLIPVLLFLAQLFIRNSELVVRENTVQQQCQHHVLESAKSLAQGIQALGALNPFARVLIQTKNAIKRAAKLQILPLPVAASMLIEVNLLQREIQRRQIQITSASLTEAKRWLTRSMPSEKYISKTSSPSILGLPHGTREAFVLHVKTEPGFENETGSPKILDLDFENQRVQLVVNIKSEKIVRGVLKPQKSYGLKKMENTTIQCAAQVTMKGIQSPWVVQLTSPRSNERIL